MPFPFVLPTTSSISFTDYLSSSTHPSLPNCATTARGVVRDVLKRHKRIPPSSQASNLSTVTSALNDYIPYLFALDAGLSGTICAGEEIDLVLVKELEVEWRSTLGSSVPGREPTRVKLKSLESELCFTLSTLAYVYSLQARAQLHTLYNATSPTPEQRATAISAAMKHFLEANSIHTYLVNRAGQWNSQPAAVDISASVLGALAELTMAEATLIMVLKDDPYPAVVIEDRNKNNKDWMFRGVDIPKVRAHLFARLCLASSEHAAKAQAMLGRSSKINDDLLKYVDDLRRTAKGKACRFLACDAESGGKTGEGIAWLRGARKELGFVSLGTEEEKKSSGFSKLKKEWQEKREDRKIERGVDWGTDAGKFEEGRVVDMLLKKWEKMNDTVGVQLVPPSEPLLASMPSGRDPHNPKMFVIPALGEDSLVRMRAPLDPSEAFKGEEDDSADEDDRTPAGAFPGTKADYAPSSSYY
ncbi:pH-response regulator protein-like protein palC [Cucurbitaria berberidis CBS 394.84]|uniref:pH-response regulator protein palC n=1 Tax=Cucurbitaria berberidis CBS 394.84 TaxID=1168544 RepID=A0A9P4L391_9PLEO|nr:pH-response regulator protein-like protein palC [Cucurbitaria berberidis CBS 394.84]KAF1840019.1 pH-response regulator protein-like protein palC [Cucurbitaria berberidis CBS 394.84]